MVSGISMNYLATLSVFLVLAVLMESVTGVFLGLGLGGAALLGVGALKVIFRFPIYLVLVSTGDSFKRSIFNQELLC